MLSFGRALESFLNKYSSTDSIKSYTNAAGIGVVSGVVYVNTGSGAQPLTSGNTLGTTTANIGTPSTSVTAVETGVGGVFHKTVLTLTAKAITVADTGAGGNVSIYTFPEGAVTITGGSFSLTPTTTSALASTLHASTVLDIGIGTVGAAGALTTTEDNIIDSVAGTASATINVAGATSTAVRTSAPAILDGHSSAIVALLNIGVPTATDIDADATVTVTGTVTILWQYNGDI